MVWKMMLAALACALVAPTYAATLIVNSSGILTGAAGVDVGGTSYDVEFVSGSCTEVFGTCSQASFAFKGVTSARSAGQALLDQVLLNVPQGQFDSQPNLTNGCPLSNECIIEIPYTTVLVGSTPFVSTIEAVNFSSSASDIVIGSTYVTSVRLPFARFTLSPAPEPATWAMMLAGFGAIGAAMRRRQRMSVRVG